MRGLNLGILTNWSAVAARALSVRRSQAALQNGQKTSAQISPVRKLSIADQWLKLTAVLNRAQQGVEHAKSLQTAAAQKLDLAQYGLQTLMDDLATVMTVPGRRQPAPVLVLGAHVVRGNVERPAAYAA